MTKTFYQSVHYEPIRNRAVVRTPPCERARVSDRYPHMRTRMLDYFRECSFERVGVLHGDYLVHPTGILVVDREGYVTATCVALEDPSIRPWLASGLAQFESEKFLHMRHVEWDDIVVADGVTIFSDPYERNFFHFCLELAPRARFFPASDKHMFVAAKTALSKTFQQDLLGRCLPLRACHMLDKFIRLRDPIVAHDLMSEDGVFWLRGAAQIRVRAGKRRLYLRRAGRGTRSEGGGGVAETPEFLKFLADNGFESVDFGHGDLGVAGQAALLEGAGVVLSAHSAGLSNIAYLDGEIGVVEIFGPRAVRAMYMHLASMLGFRYYGVISCDLDERFDIAVDLDELSEALRFVS